MEFKFGIRGHDLITKATPEQLGEALKEKGFKYVQLVFPKTFIDYSYDDEYVERVVKSLKDNDVEVGMLGAYFNPVHSDKSVVEKGVNNFKSNIRISHKFNYPPVGSETGSYNDSPWTYVPKNHTEEGYQETLYVFKQLVEEAKIHNVEMSIEAAWGHVIYDVDCLKRFVSDLNYENAYVTIDLYNLLYMGNFEDRDYIFKKALETFKERVRIIHLKDADIIENKLVQLAPGKGKFNYPYMLKLIKEHCPNACLVFEGVTGDNIEYSYNYLKELAKNI